jgi:hypothetical protein
MDEETDDVGPIERRQVLVRDSGKILSYKPPREEAKLPDSDSEILKDPHHIRSDFRMLERAVKNRWPIDDAKRNRLVEVCYQIAVGEYPEKIKLAAAKVLAQYDSINARREENDKGRGVTVNVGVNVNASGPTIDILSLSEQDREAAIAAGATIDPKQLEHLTPDELVRLHRAACSVGVTAR